MFSELEDFLGDDFAAIWSRFGSGATHGPLTCDERIALWLWTTPNKRWSTINALIVPDGPQLPIVRLLDAALAKLPTFRGVVYRGLRAPQGLRHMLTRFPRDGTVVWPGFTSSSTIAEKAVPFGGAVLLEIASRSSHLIQSFSAEFDEYEALFPRGTVVKVIRITQNQSATRALVQLEEL